MTETVPNASSLSREEQAFLIKALWESLQSPHWNKDDLIDLGKLIFAKKSLKDIAAQDEKKFARIFPHLVEIVNHLAAKMMEATAAAQAHQAATAPPQAPIPPQAPQALGTFKPIAIAGGPQVLAPQAPQAPTPSQPAAIQPPAVLPSPVPPTPESGANQ